MNKQAVAAIVRKDIREIMQSKQVLIPMIIVPLVILAVLPGLLILAVRFTDIPSNVEDVAGFITRGMPPVVRERFSGLTEKQLPIYLLVNYVFGPLFLVIPLMVSSIIAASSFAGEKERGPSRGCSSRRSATATFSWGRRWPLSYRLSCYPCWGLPSTLPSSMYWPCRCSESCSCRMVFGSVTSSGWDRRWLSLGSP